MIPKLKNTKFYSFITEHNSQIIPWGYLLNKAIKNTEYLILKQNILDVRLESVLEYSKHYISLFQYQSYEFTQFQYMSTSTKSVLDLIDKHVIGDQLLKIEQYDPESIIKYLTFINDKFNTPELNLTLELATLIINKNHNEIIDITDCINEIFKKYPMNISNKIRKLTIHNEVNKSFNTIYDLEKCDYKNKPFIRINKKIFFLNHSFFFIGFYYVFLELLYQLNIKSKEQGIILEEFAEYSLRSTSLQFIENKNYKVNKPQKKTLNINSESLEVDLVIHNKKNIALFEIKNRVLTKESKGGNSYSILEDLSESLIKSQTQLNKHKRYLLNFKEINFIDKEKLVLNNRNIIKITISSLDYQSLHSPLVSQQLLRILPLFTIKLTNDSKLDKIITNINKKITEFSNEILNPETKNEITDPHGLHNCYFINIFHFLFLIERARSKGTDFIDELTLYHNTILNQLDFYYCYFYKDKKFKI